MARPFAVLAILLVVIAIASELTEARVRVRVRTSRTRYSSGSSSRTRRKFSPSGSNKVTKSTFIPVLTRKSPVIRLQARPSTVSHLYRKSFFANMLHIYTLHKMPVYRDNYNMPNTFVRIPDERALRVSEISEVMRDINERICLPWFPSENFTIFAGVKVSHVQTSLTVDGNLSLILNKYPGVTNFTLDKEVLDKEIQVRTVVLYDGNMVANSRYKCRKVESKMEGTVVRMYATNPDGAETIRCSLIAVTLSSVLYFFLS